MIARPDLRLRLAPGLHIGRFHQQGIILNNIGQTLPRQNLLPQIIGLETIGIDRITRTVIPTLIKRQKPGRLALEMRTKHHLVFIHSKMRQTATNAEKFLPRIAVAFVLLNRICHRLFGQTIFQLKSRHGQTIDKQREVEREPLIGIAIRQLARNRKAILRVKLHCPSVARRWRAVKKRDIVRPVLHAIAKHIDNPALANLVLQPSEKPAPRRIIALQR